MHHTYGALIGAKLEFDTPIISGMCIEGDIRGMVSEIKCSKSKTIFSLLVIINQTRDNSKGVHRMAHASGALTTLENPGKSND